MICPACGKERPLSRHHIIPRAKGGSDKSWNIILLCLQCHDDFEELHLYPSQLELLKKGQIIKQLKRKHLKCEGHRKPTPKYCKGGCGKRMDKNALGEYRYSKANYCSECREQRRRESGFRLLELHRELLQHDITTRGGRPRVGVDVGELKKLSSQGLGCLAIARRLADRGLFFSPSTVWRRLRMLV